MESSQRNKFHVKNLHRSAMLLCSILTFKKKKNHQDGGTSGAGSGREMAEPVGQEVAREMAEAVGQEAAVRLRLDLPLQEDSRAHCLRPARLQHLSSCHLPSDNYFLQFPRSMNTREHTFPKINLFFSLTSSKKLDSDNIS